MNVENKSIEDETKFVVKNMIQLSLSCDHRVMDGVMGANFINTVKKQELNWIEMIFQVLGESYPSYALEIVIIFSTILECLFCIILSYSHFFLKWQLEQKEIVIFVINQLLILFNVQNLYLKSSFITLQINNNPCDCIFCPDCIKNEFNEDIYNLVLSCV